MGGHKNIYEQFLREQNVFASIDDIISMASEFIPNLLASLVQGGNISKIAARSLRDSVNYYNAQVKKVPLWKNPELFKVSVDLARNTDPKKVLSLIDTLERQLGITKPQTTGSTVGVTRLFHARRCFLVNGNKIKLTESNHFRLDHTGNGQGITVILPIQNIYAGFIPEQIYPAQFTSQFQTGHLKKLVNKSFRLIQTYSPTLYNEVFQLTSYIFLTPDFGDKVRYSYNLRTEYFGAIFINPGQTDEIRFAESVIHEFIHQRLWMQWAYQLPDLNDYEQIKIVSPFTGRPKSLPVMVHACIIYTILRDFYKFLLTRQTISLSQSENLEQAIHNSNKKIPALYSQLSGVTSIESPFNEILNQVNELNKINVVVL